MAYFNTCTKCGANLDPGEHCDCEEDESRNEVEKTFKVIKEALEHDKNSKNSKCR